MATTFKTGDHVKYTGKFLKSVGWYTNVPKDGRVNNVRDFNGRQLVNVTWCDNEEPMNTLACNLMLAGKPDYSNM
jgi:hypothetical protein